MNANMHGFIGQALSIVLLSAVRSITDKPRQACMPELIYMNMQVLITPQAWIKGTWKRKCSKLVTKEVWEKSVCVARLAP